MRRTSPAIGAVCALAAVLVAAGCGSAAKQKAAGGGGTTTTTATSDSALAGTSLRIVLLPGFIANPKTTVYTLTCAPDSGTLPDPASACAKLAANTHMLDSALRCNITVTDVGSQKITGTLAGKPVDLQFVGCQRDFARWGTIATAFGLR